jgi:hydroxyacylglutathione hydrolase
MASGMFIETIRSEGLAHLSYLIGHGGKAAVIDPRRDFRIYIEKALGHGARIDCIFETHRNEDYVIGSPELSELTGAKIYHGTQLDFRYGNPAVEGDSFELGDLTLRVIETPGHTFESLSIVVMDRSTGNEPIGVFTGDALFIGDVGRTDFFPGGEEEMAGLLYDSIFKKLLPLGDHVILFPAHGAGSVCGESMAEREFSTLDTKSASTRPSAKKIETTSSPIKPVNITINHPTSNKWKSIIWKGRQSRFRASRCPRLWM